MPLVLQIENVDRLPDGGPVRIMVGSQGCQVGRNSTMHWVLPDPSRMISGHHFDISFTDGGWWLTDRSTNGTFLQGSRYRLDQPYRLRHMDRFQVGHYLIVALIKEPAPAPPPPSPQPPSPQPAWSMPSPNPSAGAYDPPGAAYTGGIWNLPGQDAATPAASASDPWATPAPTPSPAPAPQPAPAPMPQPSPIPASQPMPRPAPQPFATPSQAAPMPPSTGRMPGQAGDFADDFVANPVFRPGTVPEPAPPPSPAPAAPPLAAPTPAPASDAPQSAILQPPPPPSEEGVTGLGSPPPAPEPQPLSVPPRDISTPPAQVSLPPQGAASPGLPQEANTPPNAGATGDLVRAFCTGAGLDPAAFADIDPEALAQTLGKTLRLTASEVMTQLQLRAAAKQFTRGGDRTMRTAEHNNPLKFLPDVEHALEAMFLRPRAGFLQGPDAMQEALVDLRHHQVALFAALQPALSQLLGDLAPEDIEGVTEGGLLGGSRKAKAWETYVARWDAKTAPHENGILDAFLMHFAAAYMESIAGQNGGRGGNGAG
ncbi:FHA domain protein [Rhodobacter aestuarii]|uniref:FHA domain protein n=1 Tax=Rhodobacter aestuarii TaxID=453582 RepID=A0A1N7JV74_9RHOB|nr:type VI secretion system-associated FHA domain protein TagH [Rhodobacter aestuarii]PTV95976.1 FHA domain protein [Rhodobacter aestuarii]SIS53239.1 FHA domain protein [Rhodobacter aestuarii]